MNEILDNIYFLPACFQILFRFAVFTTENGFGLVSLFNGISTFAGYLMPKLFS